MTADKAAGEDQQSIVNINRLIHEPSRFMIMAYLYVVESADFLFLVRQTGMTWGNLSAHLRKLEDAGYVVIGKEFLGKKPHTILRLTDNGRCALEEYQKNMRQVLDELPKQ